MSSIVANTVPADGLALQAHRAASQLLAHKWLTGAARLIPTGYYNFSYISTAIITLIFLCLWHPYHLALNIISLYD